MSDDPNKRHVDAKTVSSQPFEIDYVVDKLEKQFRPRSREVIRQAVIEAKKEVASSEDRDKVTDRAWAKLLS